MSKLNILMLNYEFPPIGGGAGQAHYALLKQYALHPELHIDVLTSAAEPGFFVESMGKHICIHRVGIHKRYLHRWRKIEVLEWLFKANKIYKKMIRQKHYDLVHAFFGFPSGWLCFRSADKLPYIISLRGSDVPGQNSRLQLEYKLLSSLFRSIWIKSKRLIACSEGLKNRALKFMPDMSIAVIPNGVALDMYTPAQVKQQNPVRLITVGRLSETKRVHILIEAVNILHKDNHKVQLSIVGAGALTDRLQKIIADYHLEQAVTLTGHVDAEDMPGMYQRHDIFVSATMQEGMSNAMLEAMACALPIITTSCEGVDELIQDNGIVVKGDSAYALAQAIKKLIADPDQHQYMSSEARKRAEMFTWDRAASEYIELYNELKAH